MTALLKPTEPMRAISSQLRPLCEANCAVSILKHISLIFATNSYKLQEATEVVTTQIRQKVRELSQTLCDFILILALS
jgi:hypothetical protein